MKTIFLISAIIFSVIAVKPILNSQNNMEQVSSKVNVWDTYVTKKNGAVMHFDIIAPVEILDTTIIYSYGRDYLKTKGQEGQDLSAKQCRLCHIETIRAAWQKEIDAKGYFIIEMEGCD